ncbi:MAG: hypothetical protein ACRDV7_05625 [Acidimicrobiia bacterium]
MRLVPGDVATPDRDAGELWETVADVPAVCGEPAHHSIALVHHGVHVDPVVREESRTAWVLTGSVLMGHDGFVDTWMLDELPHIGVGP